MIRVLAITHILIACALAEPSIFVVNNLAETMSKIEIESGNIHNHITVLGETPNDIEIYEDFLYAVNSISADLQKIDAVSGQTMTTIPLPIGSNPYSVEIADGFAYVSGWISGDIYRIDLESNSVENALQIGGFPEGMLAYNNRIYAAQTGFNPDDFSYGQGRIAIIELGAFTLIDEIEVGTNPQSITLAPNGKLHVICTGNYNDIEGSVYIFDTQSGSIEDSILIGGQPVSGVISTEGIGFLAAGGWISDGYVYSYNTDTKQILRGPSNPILVGLGTSDIALDSMGIIYTTNFGGDSVTKLSPYGQIMATYQMGDGPQALVVSDNRINSVEETPNLPEQNSLLTSYPNPFNGNTIIIIDEQDAGNVQAIEIIDIQGRLVKTLYPGTGSASGLVSWNGVAQDGMVCASGIYLALPKFEPYNQKKVSGKLLKMTKVN